MMLLVPINGIRELLKHYIEFLYAYSKNIVSAYNSNALRSYSFYPSVQFSFLICDQFLAVIRAPADVLSAFRIVPLLDAGHG